MLVVFDGLILSHELQLAQRSTLPELYDPLAAVVCLYRICVLNKVELLIDSFHRWERRTNTLRVYFVSDTCGQHQSVDRN